MTVNSKNSYLCCITYSFILLIIDSLPIFVADKREMM
jgi:hypothetical protein